MPVAYILDFSSGTTENYDAVMERMDLGGRLPAGAHFHAAGPTADGLRVVDVWESAETFGKFAETQIGPHTQAIGLGEPKVTEIKLERFQRGEDAEPTFLQIVRVPGTAEQVNAVADEIAKRLGDATPAGGVMHCTGSLDDGYVIINAWTSRAARDTFRDEYVRPASPFTPQTEELELHNSLTKETQPA